MDGRILQPPTRGTVSLREHLSPRLCLHRRCRLQRLACMLCRVVEILHRRARLLPWAPLSPVARRGGTRPPKSLPSPPREVEVVRLGVPPVQERADQLVVEAKA
jgi:hypothetical protein